VDTITNETGGVVQRLSYDAWGKRRNTNGTDATSITAQTTRGFTRHEHDDEVGLVNMNAREFDPLLGRFATPDTIIQFPYSSQGMNRYTYVNNNPLSFTDPSGHSLKKKLKKAVQKVAHSIENKIRADLKFMFRPSIRNAFNAVQAQPGMHYVDKALMKYSWARQGLMAASAFCGPAAAYCAAGASSYTTMLMGGSSSDALKAGAAAGLSSYANQWIDSPSGGMQYSNWQAAAVYGTAQGVANKLQGGSFSSGFLGSGLGQYGRLQLFDSNLNLGSVDFSYKGVSVSIDLNGYYAEALLGASEAAGRGGNIATGAAMGVGGGIFRDAQNLGLVSWGTVNSIFSGSGMPNLPAGLNVDVVLLHKQFTTLGISASGPSGSYGVFIYQGGRDWYDWEATPNIRNILKDM
jgi:RHS repeat-associated protein